MTEMDLPEPRDPCRNCGLWGHEHDKEMVFKDDGSGASYYEYHCPEDVSSVETMRERLTDRVGSKTDQLVEEFRKRRQRGGST